MLYYFQYNNAQRVVECGIIERKMIMQDWIRSALVLFALSVITIGLTTLAHYMMRRWELQETLRVISLKLENTGWLLRYCQRNRDSKGEYSLIEERYNLLKEKTIIKLKGIL